MKCELRPPVLLDSDARSIFDALARKRAGYVSEWTAVPGSGDAGLAMNAVFARFLEIQTQGVNALPQRLQLEFLETLGANVLPAQPARAPLVFQLVSTASGDATVPLGTRVAAVLPPPAPSVDGSGATGRAPSPEFFTEQEILAMRGSLAALYSIDPQADTFADHTATAAQGFSAFQTTQPVPHRLYLGQGELFNFKDSAQIVLSFDFASSMSLDAESVQRPLLLDWEYLSVNGWQPLVLVEDGTHRFTRDGKITLAKVYGPPSKEDAVAGQTSCWIRGTVSSRSPHARVRGEPAGYLVRYTTTNALVSIEVGDEVRIGTNDVGVVLLAGEGYLIFAAPLPGATAGAELLTAGAVAFGIVASAPPAFRIPVENARDLLPGDVITLDGTQQAAIEHTDPVALYVDAELAGARPGISVELVDALPPLRPDGADEEGALPRVDVVRARVGLGHDDLPLDAAFLDSFRVDTSKDFWPFGEQPARFSAFYLACNEAFGRRRAAIEINLTFSQLGTTSGGAQLAVEYFNGDRWVALGANDDFRDDTHSLTQGAAPGPAGPWKSALSFVAPLDWQDYEINGDRQRWLRLRLRSGDYGQPLAVSVVQSASDPSAVVVNATPATLRPPVIAKLAVKYRYFTQPQALDYCVVENDFALMDRSEEARWARGAFAPFMPVSDRTPALHFGFSSRPPAGLVSLLVQVLEAAEDGDPQPFVWEYWGTRGWTELSVRDATSGLRSTGTVQFVGTPDAQPRDGLGGALYRVRARLKGGLATLNQIVRCGGVWLNGVWARQGVSVERESLAISTGLPGQSFALPVVRGTAGTVAGAEVAIAANGLDFDRALDAPLTGVAILGDEKVEVREWAGRGDDWQTALAGVDHIDIRFESDPQDPSIKTAAWVRWHARPHLFASGAGDRHYVPERARGVFHFPAAGGFAPPAGAPIVVSYVTGGGIVGNVPAGAVRELRSGVGFVQSVSNPFAASGGAATESLRAARDRSIQQLRHRDRAVSREDYEWLATAASSEVARVRALPLEGPAGRGARGFVGLLLVPHSAEAMPVASPELCRRVLESLAARVPAGISSGIRIIAPSYLPVGVRAEILPLRAEDSGRVEARVRARLTRFLHPLSGGADGRGWQFGESVYLSDLAALIETTEGVDAVRFLQLMVGQRVYADQVGLEPHQLIAAGDSQLKIIVPSVPYALA